MNVDRKTFQPRKRPTTMFLFNFSLYDYTQSLSIIKWYLNVYTDCGAIWVDERLQETLKKYIFTHFVVSRHLCVSKAIKPDEKCGVTIMKSFENLSGSISVSCLPNLADDDDESETFSVFSFCLPTHFYSNKLCPEWQHPSNLMYAIVSMKWGWKKEQSLKNGKKNKQAGKNKQREKVMDKAISSFTRPRTHSHEVGKEFFGKSLPEQCPTEKWCRCMLNSFLWRQTSRPANKHQTQI